MLAFLLNLVIVCGVALTAANFVDCFLLTVKHDIELRAKFPEFAEEGLL